MKQRRDNPTFFEAAPRTVIPEGAVVAGKLSFDVPVKIDSRFKGEVKANGLLVIGPNGQVNAKISAGELRIEGSLVGNVHVEGWIEILPGGRFQGKIQAGKLKIHAGGVFEGQGYVSCAQLSSS